MYPQSLLNLLPPTGIYVFNQKYFILKFVLEMESDISASVIRLLLAFLLSNFHFTRRKWQTIHYMAIGNSFMTQRYVTTDTTSGVRYELMISIIVIIIIVIIIIVIIIIFSRSSSREKVPEEMIILFIHSLFSLHFAFLFCFGNRS